MISVRKLAVAAGLTFCLSAQAMAQEVTLRFHSFIHATSYQQVKFFEPWCERIKEQSDGRMVCQIFPSMQLGGSPAELINQAKDGIVDIVYGNPGYKPGAYLSAEVFELPFMMTDVHQAARGMWDYMSEHAGSEFEGVRLIAIAPADFAMIQTKEKPVRTMEDLKRLKLRASGRYVAKDIEALGAVPVQMPGGEITEALNRGVIDGAYLPWSAVRLLKLGEIIHHYTDFAPSQPKMFAPVQVMVMGKMTYDRLPEDLKKVIDDNSGQEASVAFADAFASTAAEDMDIVGKSGGDIYILPDSEFARWQEATSSIAGEWVKDANAKGLDGEMLLQAAKDALAKYQN